MVGRGETSKSFTHPKDILAACSRWFGNVFKETHFLEAQRGRIDLPDDDPAVFEAFLYFAYNGCLEFTCLSGVDPAETRAADVLLLIKVWIFGDRYLLPALQNIVMHRLCETLRDGPEEPPLTVSAVVDLLEFVRDHELPRLVVADYLVVRRHHADSVLNAEEEFKLSSAALRALHLSLKAFHELTGSDFSRYKKPTKYRDILFTAEEEEEQEEDGEGDESSTAYYTNTWGLHRHYCRDCGFRLSASDEVPIVCSHCKTGRCTCGKQNFVVLCEDCSA